MITGIQAGKTGTFVAVLTPVNGAQAPATVPQWIASDPAVALAPSPDGLSVVAGVPAGFAAPSFDLVVTAVSSDAAVGTVSATHAIPVLAASLTAIDFDQTA